MHTLLRPEIREALASFRRRHRRLHAVRAACAVLLAAIPAWVLLAILDRYVLLPDGLRWGLGIAVYAGCLPVAWKAGLRAILGARSPRAVARLIEREEPELREEMLAAIELGEATAEEADRIDSRYFREKLQDQVAAQVRNFDPVRLLPFRGIALPVFLLGLTIAAVTGLLFVSSLNFGAFLARAMIPFADFARPADVTIRLAEPSPGDRMVPAHENISIAVDLEGRMPRHVYLQIDNRGEAQFKRELERTGERRYSGEIPVGDGSLRYRVLAGTSATRFYSLDVRARPAVTSFLKTTRHPDYTGWEDRIVESENGDLEALQGSEVDLVIRTSEPLSSGEVRLEGPAPDAVQIIALECRSDGGARARVPVSGAHESYSLRVVSRETGFESGAPVPYEVRALPDQPPVVEITSPAGENIEIRPDASLPLRALAVDDVRLAEATRSFRINGRAWSEVSLPAIDGLRAELAEDWYLGDLKLEGGDVVLTKFLVTDAAGNPGESLPVKVLIVADPVTPAAREWLTREDRVRRDVESLAKAATEAQKAIEMAKNALRPAKREPNAEEAGLIALAQQAAARVIEEAERARESIREALATAPGRIEAMEMRAAGERLAEMRNEHLAPLEEMFAAPREAQKDKDEPRQSMARARSAAQSLHAQVQTLVAEDRAQILTKNLEDLSEQQRSLAKSAPSANPRLGDQQEAAFDRGERARREFERLRDETGGLERKIAYQTAKEMEKTAENFRKLAAEEGNLQAAQEMSLQVDRAAQNAARIHDELARKGDELRNRMLREMSQPSRAIAEAENKASELARDAERATARGRKPSSRDREQQAAAAEELRARLETAAEMLEEEAALEEIAPRADAQAVTDRNRLARALDELAEGAAAFEPAPASPEEARAIADAMKTLESIDRFLAAEAMAKETEDSLREMARDVLYPGRDRAETFSRNAVEWAGRLRPALDLLPQALSSSTAREAAEVAREMQESEPARALDAQMEARRKPGAPKEPPTRDADETAERLRDLAEDAARTRAAMGPQIAEARARLEAMAPSLAEMMGELATGMDAESASNRERAEVIAEGEPAPAAIAGEVARAMEEGASADDELDELVQAVRQETNNLDPADAAERELARTGDAALEAMRRARPEVAETLGNALRPAADRREPAKAESANTGEATPANGRAAAAALQDVAQQQGEMAETLEELAAVFEALEGKPAAPAEPGRESATGKSRDMAENLGIDEPLDAFYERAANLAEMSGMAEAPTDSLALMQALESELARNPGMQRELEAIATTRAAEAASRLREAESDEQALAETVAATARSGKPASGAVGKQEAITKSVAGAGELLEEAARHEGRLGNAAMSEQLQEESEAVRSLTAEELATAEKALRESAAPPIARTIATGEARVALTSLLEEMNIPPASPPSPPGPGEAQAGSAAAEEARMLAQALDQVDRQLHPPAQEPPAPSRPSPAEENLDAAKRMQGAAMAQARQQGLVPGQSGVPSGSGQTSSSQASASPAPGSESDGAGAGLESADADAQGGALPGAAAHSSLEDWGQLPERLAGNLREGRRQESGPDYRGAIESYYTAVARRAREKK